MASIARRRPVLLLLMIAVDDAVLFQAEPAENRERRDGYATAIPLKPSVSCN